MTVHTLVMSGSSEGALACIQSFGRRNHIVSVIDSTGSPNCRSRFVTEVIATPLFAGMEAAARYVIQLVNDKGVDLVVPISDVDAHVLAIAKEIAPHNKALVIGPSKSVEIVRSRNATTALCRRLDVPIPRTLCVADDTNMAEMAADFGFPFYLKRSRSTASQGVRLVESVDQFRQALAQSPPGAEYQFQKPISGNRIGTTGFAIDGNLIESFSFAVEYRFSQGGTPAYATSVIDESLDKLLGRIATELNWTGGIDIDFLKAENGDIYLLEINPRLSGTVTFPQKLGVDFPYLYLWTREGRTDYVRKDPKTFGADAYINRSAEVAYVSQNPSNRCAEAREFRQRHAFVDNMYWDDIPLTQATVAQLLEISWTARSG